MNTLAVRLPEDLINRIDEYAQADRITRADAIRQLLYAGLEASNRSPKLTRNIRLGVRLPGDLINRIDQYAETKPLARADAIRQLLYAGLEEEKYTDEALQVPRVGTALSLNVKLRTEALAICT